MEEVKQDFLESLNDLTFNSRPLIQGLTEIAAECKEYGKGVADAIEQHLSTCPRPSKIPTLYVMDSILKNIGQPYTDLFAAKVYRMVTESYRHLGGPEKQKLQNLVKTWMAPQPKTGVPVFPGAIIDQISSFFASQSNVGPPQQAAAAPQQRLNQSSVQVEINRMLKFLDSAPKDKDTEYQIGVLQRLQSSLSSKSADQETLKAAQQQVNNFKQRQEHLLKKRQSQRGPSNDRDSKRKKPYGRDSATGSNSSPVGTRQESSVSDLFSSLQNSGLFGPKDVPSAAPAVAVAVVVDFGTLSQPRPELIAKLYSDLPIQCSICGKRFPNTPEGQKAKEEELDWHFRVNNSIAQGRSHSRMYLLTASQWVDYSEDEQIKQEEKPAIDFEAEAKKVVAVPDDHDETCHICGEKFNTIWSEDAEEWVFENAIEVDTQIFHATCYADPENKTAIESILAVKAEA